MIAFRDNLPLIEMPNGEAVAFERDWLVRSLARAAHHAGYEKWWLAEHVAESVTAFLRDQQTVTVLAIEKLTSAVQSVLQVIGYGEIGRYFVPTPPRVQISLLELARAADTGYELAFFEILGRRIHELAGEKNAHFELVGLEPCVKLLRSRKTWSRDCDALRAEIVTFTREQTGTAAAGHEVIFSLA
jgi:hypothetical protein